MTEQLKIGVIGCGKFAETTAIPAILDTPGLFSLAGVASRTAEKANEFATRFGCAAYSGYESMLLDPAIQVIYLPLPTGLHDEWIQKSIDSGKHVLVEKSMSTGYDSAKQMIEAARKKNVLIAENFMFQYHRQMAFVVEQLRAGVIGELRQLRSSFGFPPLPRDNFRFDNKLGGGALLDAGAYTIKVAQIFLGHDLEVKSASLADTMGVGVDTMGAAHLVNNNGVTALIGFGFDHFYQCNFELWGSLGKLTATRAFTAKPGFSPDIVIDRQGETETVSIDEDYPFKHLLEKIHLAITEKDFEPFRNEALCQARLIQGVKVAANE